MPTVAARSRESPPRRGAGDAEIGQLHDPAGGNQDVGGFDVAVNHTPLMGERQGGQHLGDRVDGPGNFDGPALQRLFQRDAVHQFHNHDQAAVHAQGGVECCDIRMLQAGMYFDFAQKPIRQAGILIQVRKHHLHGLFPFRQAVPHAKHLTHAAAAQKCP